MKKMAHEGLFVKILHTFFKVFFVKQQKTNNRRSILCETAKDKQSPNESLRNGKRKTIEKQFFAKQQKTNNRRSILCETAKDKQSPDDSLRNGKRQTIDNRFFAKRQKTNNRRSILCERAKDKQLILCESRFYKESKSECLSFIKKPEVKVNFRGP